MATIQVEVSDNTAARFSGLTAADRQRIDGEIEEILSYSLPQTESAERKLETLADRLRGRVGRIKGGTSS